MFHQLSSLQQEFIFSVLRLGVQTQPQYWWVLQRLKENLLPDSLLVSGNNQQCLTSLDLYGGGVQSLSPVQLFAIPWTAAHQASLSIINSRSLLKLMSTELVIQQSHPLMSPSPPDFDLS